MITPPKSAGGRDLEDGDVSGRFLWSVGGGSTSRPMAAPTVLDHADSQSPLVPINLSPSLDRSYQSIGKCLIQYPHESAHILHPEGGERGIQDVFPPSSPASGRLPFLAAVVEFLASSKSTSFSLLCSPNLFADYKSIVTFFTHSLGVRGHRRVRFFFFFLKKTFNY